MTNPEKVEILLSKLPFSRYRECIKVKDGVVLEATWDEHPHCGKIMDYKETPMCEKSVLYLIGELEMQYGDVAYGEYVSNLKKNLVKKLYQ